MIEELPVVGALRSLSVFSANQAGAYREHSTESSQALGPDVVTKLTRFVVQWAESGQNGTLILTGNAGTGKTAAAEAFSLAVGGVLPRIDDLVEISPGRQVVKDLSGLPDPESRARLMRAVLDAGSGQTMICANEGVLRDALEDSQDSLTLECLEQALREGAATSGQVTIVNVNRQRPTAESLWPLILDYVAAEENWSGCSDCPFDLGGCPTRTNAEKFRQPGVRAQLRMVFRLAAGEAVPTLRETLSILSWALVGDDSCETVKSRQRDLGQSAFTANSAYFTRVLGGGLPTEAIDRSPLLSGIQRSGLGIISDLEVDGWLRDASGASPEIQSLAGEDPNLNGGPLTCSSSPLDRVQTKQGVMTFFKLGEMVSTDEDPTRVEDGLDALVVGDSATNRPAQMLWRQRIFFEGTQSIHGAKGSARRLLEFGHFPELLELAQKAASGSDTVIELNELVRGLNFLVTGFSSPNEGLIVPDPACLFSRDPGSFRPARPSLVHSQVELSRLSVRVPDQGLVQQILDVDHVDVLLLVDNDPSISLRIRPRTYEAIREAADFQGPVGQGVAEMSDLRGFYGQLANLVTADEMLRVADPDSNPPALVKIILPHQLRPGNSNV